MEQSENKRPYHLGLALSGGGVRGFAHLGVYKAMQELGIRPDIISGTSAGAIAGVMLASGHTAEESFAFFHETKMLDLAWPVVSRMGVMAMHGLEKRLADFIEVEDFEELPIPLVVTATNMNAGVPEHFNTGKILPPIIASSSVPIVFTPVVMNHQQYVDGGVFMNLPARPIRELCDVIIGVHIDPLEPSEHIKNMVHLAARSFHMGILSNMNTDAKICDILISPKRLCQYGMFDLNNIEKIFNDGYREAKSVFSKVKNKTLLGLLQN